MFELIIYNSGAIPLTEQTFSDHQANILLQDVNCNGSETTLLNCEYSTLIQSSCQPLEDAGVICQGSNII